MTVLVDSDVQHCVQCNGCERKLGLGHAFRAAVRGEARRKGWTQVLRNGQFRDFCPDCEALEIRRTSEKHARWG